MYPVRKISKLAPAVFPGRSGPTGSVVSSWPSGLMIRNMASTAVNGSLISVNSLLSLGGRTKAATTGRAGSKLVSCRFSSRYSCRTCRNSPLQFLKLLQDRYQFIRVVGTNEVDHPIHNVCAQTLGHGWVSLPGSHCYTQVIVVGLVSSLSHRVVARQAQ